MPPAVPEAGDAVCPPGRLSHDKEDPVNKLSQVEPGLSVTYTIDGVTTTSSSADTEPLTTPGQGKAEPVSVSPTPGVKEEEPVDDSPTPGVKEEEPVDDSPAPGVKGEEPVDDSPAPGVKGEEPVDDSPAPGVKEEEPVDVSPAPGVKEEEEPVSVNPAPKEEEPVPVSSASGTKGEEPVDVSPALGVKEEEEPVSPALGVKGKKDVPRSRSVEEPGTQAAGDGDGAALVCEAEEEKDRVSDVPVRSPAFRPSIRSLSPFRRHSWGPGKNSGSEAEMNHRSSGRLLGDVKKPPIHRRSLSWCPSGEQQSATEAEFSYRSYSLEGLVRENVVTKEQMQPTEMIFQPSRDPRRVPLVSTDGGSLVSLTEEEMESDQIDSSVFHDLKSPRAAQKRSNPPLTKSISLLAISPSSIDGTRWSSSSSALGHSISEECCSEAQLSPTRKDLEGRGGTKVSRTFSYLRNKMSSGKQKHKEKERVKEKEAKEKDKKVLIHHAFCAILVYGSQQCHQCNKVISSREAYLCTNCNVQVHKSCRDSAAPCSKIKQRPQKNLQANDISTLPVIMRTKTFQPKERPRSAIILQDDSSLPAPSRKLPTYRSMSKSMSIANIAGPAAEEIPFAEWRAFSQSTESLTHHTKQATESTESLTDEGTDVMDGQLMGEFEPDAKEMEADSWSLVVESKFVHQHKKEVIKRQDVIYELMQTEMHHLRTLKIMCDVYVKGLSTELQLDAPTLERLFPCLEDLIDIHSHFFYRILERRRDSLAAPSTRNFLIDRIGDILLAQFSGPSAERMKKTYGKFCGRHNEAVNLYKDLLNRDKRFQTFIRKKMSSAVVRRLGIQECILLVTQRITKYPVIVQRILQHTRESEEDHPDLTRALTLIKEVIAAVDNKVSEYEKKSRLNEIYSRTETKAIMRMKSGQMFAKEDIKRRKLVHDGPVTLKAATGRLKEVQAVLLSDVLLFLQEKDQKYTFASLDQKATVVPLQKLLVREVAHEGKGLFLISAATKEPEMYELHASSKEERTTWIHIIQQTASNMGQDEDEGIPSESEEDKRQLETKARELREKLQERDQQIVSLLEEKLRIFGEILDSSGHEEATRVLNNNSVYFRANPEAVPRGDALMSDALKEVETLQNLLSMGFAGAISQPLAETETGTGHVSLPRRAETFGGFDSHQMSAAKNGEKEEVEDGQDLRRTESDSVLKKGGNTTVLLPLRKNELVLHKVLSLNQLLHRLQAVVVQQDTYIEDQRQAVSERAERGARLPGRPSSLVEQEKQRSLEKQRQEQASLRRQQTQHQEERRRWEREWDVRQQELADRETVVAGRESEATRLHREAEREKTELQLRKEEYQQDLERLRAAQRQLEREREQLRREQEQAREQRPGSLSHTDSITSQASDLQSDSSGESPTQGNACPVTFPSASPLPAGVPKAKGSEPPLAQKEMDTAQGKGKSGCQSPANPIPPRLLKLAKSKKSKHRKGKGHRPGNSPSELNPEAPGSQHSPVTPDGTALIKGPNSSASPATDSLSSEEVFYC
ncbi:A-kinase anchor protein 13 isoform X1 [Callorhinchus milii]|uniref:A-kinase anchor protein 13 isoform X1 n=1 Tax=Callorhinchus milii TaxID=7868 RepID=UPI001C3FAB79|nr:A-kinase anchor protein 13 isoform X1 [Callorhinchus milii]